MAGYSTTPLVKKLGIKENFRVALVGAPEGFDATLGALPVGVKLVTNVRQRPINLALLFTKKYSELDKRFATLAAALSPDGSLWVAWPKKASGVATDLTFASVQEAGLAAGLVDVKICAVDGTWSGLKFVYRLKGRPC